MSRIIPIKMCSACNFNNPGDSKECNRCGKKFNTFMGGKGYTQRWQCPICYANNAEKNKTCYRCNYKSDEGDGSCAGVIAVLVIIFIIAIFAA